MRIKPIMSQWGNFKKRAIVALFGMPILVFGVLYIPFFPLIFTIALGAGITIEWSILFYHHQHDLAWKQSFYRQGFYFAVLLYIISPFIFFCQNEDATIKNIVLLFLVIVWLTDMGAYFVGRTIGGPLLASRISPKKTWSGAVGGVLCVLMAVPFLTPLLPVEQGFLLCAGLSIMGQCGDLIESKFKRMLQVKESGSFLPGHGGLFDRFDSLIGTLYGYLLFQLLYIA